MFIRRDLLTRLCKLLQDGGLTLHIDRIPVEMRPRNNGPIRCCVHKDRAVLKYKLMACLGYNIEDETDELTPISEYAAGAQARKEITDVKLTVVDEACSSCSKANYVVTNMCHSCVGRPCQVNCPKDAINFATGRAQIDAEKCVNCGLCMSNCPFHAIIYTPVPCESACPVNAISKDKNGIARIDHDKCIFCGRCYESCPYGAVMEKSHLVEIYSKLRASQKVVAMVAPALYGQFKVTPDQIHQSLLKLGFNEIIEVAEGALETVDHEATEFRKEVLEGDQSLLTTSCCPAYKELVVKHIPGLEKYMSTAGSPLFYTAKNAREKNADAVLVFISPCMAKRHEAFTDKVADYTLNFEELGAMMAAKGIEVTEVEAALTEYGEEAEARIFAFDGGVTEMVKNGLEVPAWVRDVQVSGIDKVAVKQLRKIASGKCEGNFVEVMACPDGCVSGCNTIAKASIAKRQVKKYAQCPVTT